MSAHQHRNGVNDDDTEIVDLSDEDNEILDLFASLRRVGKQVTARSVRPDAIRAIRLVETQLIASLAGNTLKGLPNLGPRSTPFYGACLRCPDYSRKISQGAAVLVLTRLGSLALVRFVETASLSAMGDTDYGEWHPIISSVPDEALFVEDVERVVRVVRAVLDAHLAIAEQSSDKFAALQRLAQKCRDVMLVS